MNKIVLTAILASMCAAPAFANDYLNRLDRSNAQLQRGQDRLALQQAEQRYEATCRYQSNQSPSMQYGYSQPITRQEYPITVDQQYQSPYVYNP